MQLKIVCVYSPSERLFRLFRLVGQVGTPGDGVGYSYKLSLAFGKDFPFVRLIFHRSYGGVYV